MIKVFWLAFRKFRIRRWSALGENTSSMDVKEVSLTNSPAVTMNLSGK